MHWCLMSPFLQCDPGVRDQDSGDGDRSARTGGPIPFRRVPVFTTRAGGLGLPLLARQNDTKEKE